MIVDFEKSDYATDEVFDVCIVGAGAAGLCLAYELLEEKGRVILVESGSLNRWERRSQALNRVYTSGFPFDGAHAGRFRGVGGTTSAWAGQIMEFDELDFDRRPWVPGSSWPIRKADLVRFYKRAAELEGISGVAQDDDAVWSELGIQAPKLGEDLKIGFSRFCPEPKFSRVFSSTINHRRIVLLTHANACRLNFTNGDRSRVESISFRSLNGRESLALAKNFVLCLGGIESSRFLLNQTYCPWDIAGLVGKNFQDHVRCHAGEVSLKSVCPTKWFFGPRPLADRYTPKIKLSPSAQQRHKLLNVCGMIETHDNSYRTMRTAVQVLLGPATSVTARQLVDMSLDAPAVVWQHLKSKLAPTHHSSRGKPFLIINCEQPPQSASTISLSNERDKVGLRRAHINWQVSDWEIRTIQTYVQLAVEFFNRTKLAEIFPDKRLFTDEIREIIVDHFHHCSGTRMASSPDNGIVDPNLCLFGTNNAYVCSPSVFPCSGFGNPTHTLIALAVRLSQHLRLRLT